MNKINAVVIDDEASNRELIVKLLRELNANFEVKGEANNLQTAYDLISRIKPDVVFLDIRMPDGTGFMLLSLFKEITFEVVFISGFDSYALKAFEFNALDYILKPVDPEKFTKTLLKIQSRINKRERQDLNSNLLLQSFSPNDLVITKIPVHKGNMVNLIAIEDIIYIKSESSCTIFKTSDQDKHISSKQLANFDFILEHHPYMARINKSVYINLNFISSYSKGISCNVFMKDNSVFEISRRKKREILELLLKKGNNAIA